MSCKECEYAPKTYEEFWLSKQNYFPSYCCPDAYTEKSHLCGNYGKEDTSQESEK